MDLISVYWMGDAIAHTMLSFGFSDGDYVAFSIEIRKEKNEDYSTIRDCSNNTSCCTSSRTNGMCCGCVRASGIPMKTCISTGAHAQGEYPEAVSEYVKRVQSLEKHPEFYNTVTTNCTTDIIHNIRAFGGKARYSWKILLSGYTPQYAYENKALDTSLPFPELRTRSYVNDIANRIGDVPDFSQRIREGLPACPRLISLSKCGGYSKNPR